MRQNRQSGQIRKISAIFLALILGAGLNGCAKKTNSSNTDMAQAGVGDSVRFYGTNMSPEDERQWLSKNIYYFDYDSYDISEQDMVSLASHAKRLAGNANARIRLEGHTDERGSREYNIALGERRAKAVANLLMLKGVSPNQISVVSYGKEKPANFGHDESSWSQNRRGVIMYEG